MMHLLRSLWLILLLTSVNSFANSAITFTNLNVNGFVACNIGGDNFRSNVFGSQVDLAINGDTANGWFGCSDGSAPGTAGPGDTNIYPGFGYVVGKIGSFDCSGGVGDCIISVTPFYIGGFRFPTDRHDFSVDVPFTIGLMSLDACDFSVPSCQTYDLITKPGTLTFTYSYDQYVGLYYPIYPWATFTTVPEPGTLGLLTIGFGLLPWHRHKKRA